MINERLKVRIGSVKEINISCIGKVQFKIRRRRVGSAVGDVIVIFIRGKVLIILRIGGGER